MDQKLFAQSVSRYNGGVKVKRAHGSSTVTTFLVGVVGSAPASWREIDGYGPTPGERASYAKREFAAQEAAKRATETAAKAAEPTTPEAPRAVPVSAFDRFMATY